MSHERDSLEEQDFQVEKTAFAMTAIFLNILTIPVTIVMNVLVIMAVKTRPRLQSKYNILLACLAGTGLLVGAATQPSYIVGQIYVIKGISLPEYCGYHKLTNILVLIPIFASVLHLALISIERFVAMKYTFSYVTIVTGFRLKIVLLVLGSSHFSQLFCKVFLKIWDLFPMSYL